MESGKGKKSKQPKNRIIRMIDFLSERRYISYTIFGTLILLHLIYVYIQIKG